MATVQPAPSSTLTANQSPNSPGVGRPDSQLIEATKARISDLTKTGLIAKDLETLLISKLNFDKQEGQSAIGLGGGVSAAQMNKMLDKLQALKSKGLSEEHIQGLLIAGFVGHKEVSPGVRGGGVAGVLKFLDEKENPQIVGLLDPSGGLERLKTLLSSDYKRQLNYIFKFTDYIDTTLDSTLKKIFGRDILTEWDTEIGAEDNRVIQGELDASETWADLPADGGQYGFLYHHPVLRRLAAGRRAQAGKGLCVTGVLETMAANGVPNPAATGNDPCNPRGLAVQLARDFGWKALDLGGKSKTLNSPYGNATVNVISGADYERAVKEGLIPSGAIVFQTRNSWMGNPSQSSGYDAAIALKGGQAHWNGGSAGTLIYGDTREVFVLVPGSA